MKELNLSGRKNPFLVRQKRESPKLASASPATTGTVYAYFRGSNDDVDKTNQHYELKAFCQRQSLIITYYVEETISGAKHHGERKLGALLYHMQPGDLLVVSELSRLARNLLNLMEILRYAMDKGIQIRSVKDNYVLGDDITSKVLAFAFGLASEVERKMISDRVKVALAKKKAEGVKLGRPVGSKKKNLLADAHSDYIRQALDAGKTQAEIARKLKCHRFSIADWQKRHGYEQYGKKIKNLV